MRRPDRHVSVPASRAPPVVERKRSRCSGDNSPRPAGGDTLGEKLTHDKIKSYAGCRTSHSAYTLLTEAGESGDAFTLQYVAGHDTIKTTMRHVHPGRSQSAGRSGG